MSDDKIRSLVSLVNHYTPCHLGRPVDQDEEIICRPDGSHLAAVRLLPGGELEVKTDFGFLIRDANAITIARAIVGMGPSDMRQHGLSHFEARGGRPF
jgi:hypothetical protein